MYGGNRAGSRKKYGAMRRVVRRIKKGRRPSVATGGTSLRGLSTEIKCIDFPYVGTGLVTAGTYPSVGLAPAKVAVNPDLDNTGVYVNAPIQGNSPSTRIGNRILCTGIDVYGTVFPTAANSEPVIVRIAIVYDAQPSTTACKTNEVFSTCVGGVGAQNNRTFMNMDNRLRFKIIAMKDYVLSTTSVPGGAVTTGCHTIQVRLRKRIRLPTFFKTNTASNDMFASGGICIVAFAVLQDSGAATSAASVRLNCRTTFIDV